MPHCIVVTGTRHDEGASLPPFDRANIASHVGDDSGAVAANRSALAARAGLSIAELVVMSPVHGADVLVVRDIDAIPLTPLGRIAPPADGLVTSSMGIALMGMGADCAPVTLVDDDAGVVGVVHVGWRGLVLDALSPVVMAMRDLGASALSARIHPCICASHYAVPPERAAEVSDVVPEAVARAVDGQPAIDLRAGVRVLLARTGVVEVDEDARCTWEDPALFSHRRDGRTGRQGVLVAWVADDDGEGSDVGVAITAGGGEGDGRSRG